jgi:predicted negative regulator of RcsB-dependent stress response
MSHYEDEAQVEQLRRWWRENWMALVGGLALGLAGIFGWEAWQNAQLATAQRASQLYEDLDKTAADDKDRLKDTVSKLIADYADTPYAAQGQLLVAQRAVERNDFESARDSLNWVIGHSGDPGLKKIAKLRLARVLWQLGKADDALAQLDAADDDAFAALNQELRGDIQLGKGDRAAARSAYAKAMELGPAPQGKDALQRKIDQLTDAKS